MGMHEGIICLGTVPKPYCYAAHKFERLPPLCWVRARLFAFKIGWPRENGMLPLIASVNIRRFSFTLIHINLTKYGKHSNNEAG